MEVIGIYIHQSIYGFTKIHLKIDPFHFISNSSCCGQVSFITNFKNKKKQTGTSKIESDPNESKINGWVSGKRTG